VLLLLVLACSLSPDSSMAIADAQAEDTGSDCAMVIQATATEDVVDDLLIKYADEHPDELEAVLREMPEARPHVEAALRRDEGATRVGPALRAPCQRSPGGG